MDARSCDCRSVLHPDVVLMDIMMPEMNGLEATEQLATKYPRIRSIILSMNGHEEYVLQAMRAGAVGYVVKNISLAELEQAIRLVARGETYLSPAVSRHVIAGYLQRIGDAPLSPLERLTPRQRETLQLIAEGKYDERNRQPIESQRQDRGDASLPIDGSTRSPQCRGPGSICHPDGRHLPRRLAIPTSTDPPPKPRPSGRASTRPISVSRRHLARNLRPRAGNRVRSSDTEVSPPSPSDLPAGPREILGRPIPLQS